MSALDLVLLGILLVSGVLGLWRGLVVEVLSLLSWIAAFWVALGFGDDIALLLQRWIDSPTVQAVLAYVGSFIATLLIGGIVTWVVAKLVRETGLSGTDRLLGFGFGLLRGVVFCAGLVLAAGFTPLTQHPAWVGSQVIPLLLPAADWLRSWIPPNFSAPSLPLPGAPGSPPPPST